MWSYRESLEWLYARQALGVKLGLEKVEMLLDALGNPHHQYRAIHVAGTNGKGSVTLMLAETLRRSGYRVGATTSPHLVRFTERIRIGDHEVGEEEVADGLWRVRQAVEPLDAEGQPPTFFECVTALAFLLFADHGVDWAVVETGLGGRLDATNVLRPALVVITNVALDHQAQLGETLSEIAFEKAGIMKPGVPCITAARGDALLVIKATSHAVGAPMSIIGGDYHVLPDPDRLVLLRPRGESHYSVGLRGPHQHENAAIVVAAAEALTHIGVLVPERAVRGALAQTVHPGRLERIEWHGIEVLVDGAHNPAAAQAVAAYTRDSGFTDYHLVFGACADKEWEAVLAAFEPMARQVWAVPVRNPRSLAPPRVVAAATRPAAARTEAMDALEAARAAGARRILVAGSLFLAGEARAALLGQPLEEIRGTQ